MRAAVSLRDAPEFRQDGSLGKMKAWGMPGARRTRSLAWKIEKPHERSHHRSTGITRHSRTIDANDDHGLELPAQDRPSQAVGSIWNSHAKTRKSFPFGAGSSTCNAPFWSQAVS
jgi:hypothetical protein